VFLNIRTVGTRHYHLALNYALLQGVYTLWFLKTRRANRYENYEANNVSGPLHAVQLCGQE